MRKPGRPKSCAWSPARLPAAALPGYEINGWEGFFASIGTPREIDNRVNALVNEILATPEMRELWVGKGVDFIPNMPEQQATISRAAA